MSIPMPTIRRSGEITFTTSCRRFSADTSAETKFRLIVTACESLSRGRIWRHFNENRAIVSRPVACHSKSSRFGTNNPAGGGRFQAFVLEPGRQAIPADQFRRPGAVSNHGAAGTEREVELQRTNGGDQRRGWCLDHHHPPIGRRLPLLHPQ